MGLLIMPTFTITRPYAKELAGALPNSMLNQILKLRKQGVSNYDVSEQLDLPYPFVVEEAIKLALKQEHGDSKKIKRIAEESRLELLFEKAYRAFESTGSTDWYDRLIKTSERKSKLLGLDAPQEQVVTGKDGGPIKFESLNLKGLTDDELQTMKMLAMKSVQSPEESR